MKRIQIDFLPDRPMTPMTFWVHLWPEGSHSGKGEVAGIVPPLPGLVPGKGYAVLRVEIDGIELCFGSLPEIDHLMETFEQVNMPRPQKVISDWRCRHGRSAVHGLGSFNGHWLSRLPAKSKSWRFRRKALPVLREARKLFAQALPSSEELQSYG